MTAVLRDVHQIFGYIVFLVMVGVAIFGVMQSRSGESFRVQPFRVSSGLLTLQFVVGIALYGSGTYWNVDAPLVVYVHPLIQFLAVGMAHAAVARGQRETMAADAWMWSGRFTGISALLVTIGIGIASAA